MASTASRGPRGRQLWLAVVALLLLAFALRVHQLGAQSLWFDEGWSAYVASLSPGGTLDAIAEPGHTHPPGYYLTLGAWVSLAGTSETALRLLSVIQGMLLVVVGGAFTARLFGPRAGALAVGALAVLPALVVYSQETRMYMQLALLYVALAWAYWEIARRDAPRWGLWAALFVLQAMALYTHYFAAILVAWLLLVAVAEVLLRDTGPVRWAKLTRLAIVQVLCVAVYLPWLGVTVRQLTDHTPRAAEPPDLAAYISETWRFFNSGVLGMAVAEPLFAWSSAVAGVLFVVLVVAALARMRSRSGLALLVAHGLVPLVAVYLIGLGRPGVHPRYVLMAAAPLMMSLGAGIAWLTGRVASGGRVGRGGQVGHGFRVGLAAATAASFVVAWTVALNAYYGDERHHRDDVRSVAAHVSERASPTDLVLIDYDDHAFQHYYAGAAPLRVLDLVRDGDEALQGLLGRTPEGSSVFVVRWSGGRTDYRNTLPELLERSGRFAGRHDIGPFAVDQYLVEEGAMTSAQPLAPFGADFGAAQLLGAAAPATAPADDALVVATRWAAPAETDKRLKSVIEIRDPFGDVVAHGDTMILDRRGLTTDLWHAGNAATIFTVVPLPAGSPPGAYEVAAGVYEVVLAGETRDLQLRDASGTPSGTRLPLASVAVTTAEDFLSDPYETIGGLGLRPIDEQVTDQIAVEAVAIDADRLEPGQRLGVTLLWRAGRPPSESIDPALRLIVDGEPVELHAPSPLLRSHPSSSWQAGERVLDRRTALVPSDLSGRRAVLELMVDGHALALAELPVEEVPHAYVAPAYEIASGVVFPGVGELVGFSLETEGECRLELEPAPREAVLHVTDRDQCRLIVTHVWRAEGGTRADLKVFNHLLGPDRQMIAQRDGQPADGDRPTTGWLAGEYLTDRHTLTFAEGPPPAGAATSGATTAVLATFEVGLYDPVTLARVATADGDDRAVLDVELTVELPPDSSD